MISVAKRMKKSTIATMTSAILAAVSRNQPSEWPCARPASHRTHGPADPASAV